MPAKPGPKPKPTKLHVLNGNPSKKNLDTGEPKPKPIRPLCPSWLSKSAKREWRRMAPKLDRLGLLTEVDGEAFAIYCQAYARWKECEKYIDEYGIQNTNDAGTKTVAPQVNVAHKYLAIIRHFCTEFGLTPSARARMTIEKDDSDEMDEILGR